MVPLRFTTVVAITVVACILSLSMEERKQHMAYAQCEGDIPSLISLCAKYVRPDGPKIKPSKACCAVVKKVQLPCLCKYATKEIEQYVSIGKVVYVAQDCGAPLKHGSKCGSYTIPKA